MYAVLLVLLSHVAHAQLNLYLDSHSVQKLFGTLCSIVDRCDRYG